MNKNDNIMFEGFSPKALDFLKNVRVNNSKEWFEAHRLEYDDYLLRPFRDLVNDLSGHILQIDTCFEVRPSVNKTISRIYRDTRFSKDKSLYRSNMWITFKKAQKDWRDAPAFFFEISSESYRYGMGYYSASSESMDTFRKMIDEKPKEFDRIVSYFQNQDIFIIEGDRYKRTLGRSKTSGIKEWYDRKNLYLVHNSEDINRLYSKSLVEDLILGFKTLEPLYHYLCKVEERKLKTLY